MSSAPCAHLRLEWLASGMNVVHGRRLHEQWEAAAFDHVGGTLHLLSILSGVPRFYWLATWPVFFGSIRIGQSVMLLVALPSPIAVRVLLWSQIQTNRGSIGGSARPHIQGGRRRCFHFL